MSRRRLVILTVLGAAVALPILIGASCPPPSNPFFLSLTTNRLNVGTDIPSCVQGFVCISIVNAAYVDVETALYIHDGFDPTAPYKYPSGSSIACCPNPSSATIGCTCPRPGYLVGEIQLARPELFAAGTPAPPNLYPIQGSNVRVLKARESVFIQIQDGDIKTFGIAIGRTGTLLANPEITDGPRFRCSMVAVQAIPGQPGVERLPEDVPSGETFQFVIYDQNEGASPGLARLATRTGKSGTGSCPPVTGG
jgi:hypothetical protein